MSDTKQPLRETTQVLSEQKKKQPFLIPIFTCFATPCMLCSGSSYILPSLAPKTPLFFSNWLQRMALCSFPSVHLSQSEKQKHRIVEGTSGGHLVQGTAHTGPPRASCPGLHPVSSWYLQGWWPCSLLRPSATKSRKSYKEQRWKHTWVPQHLQTDTDPRGNHCSSRLR